MRSEEPQSESGDATKIPMTPRELRQQCRAGTWTCHTAGSSPGYAQCNLVILPQRYAYDFLLFCQRNPKSCPLLEVTDVGSPHPGDWLAQDADVRTDLPKYRVFRDGALVAEVTDIARFWREDFVTYFLGCSFSFEEALEGAGLPVRNVEEGKNVPMYKTNVPCRPAGIFKGNLVVTMRPYRGEQVAKAVEVTSRYPRVHGSPIHIGDPAAIGIQNFDKPDYGDAVRMKHGEVAVFWACGVTPQNVILNSKPDIAITHSPGHMFVSDIRNEALSLF